MSHELSPRAEDVAARLEKLESLTDTTLTRLGVDVLLHELLIRVREILDVDTAAVLSLEEAADELEARASSGIEEEVRQGVRVPVGTGFAGRIAASKRPVRLDRVDSTTVANPILWEKGIKVMLGVPLMSGDNVVGVLHVGRLVDQPFSDEDVDLLQIVADRVAGAVQSRRFAIEQAATDLLERSLLPTELPRCEGLSFATRYVPAEDRTVGGDWYDLFVLPSGRLWIVVGDVAGHGLHSAISMGRIRSALRAYTMLEVSPEEVLDLVDRKVNHFELDTIATVACAVSEPPYDTLHIALAGHPPPVIAIPGEAARFAEIDPSPPIGTHLALERRSMAISLPPAAVAVFYTDGLVERRTEPLDVGLERLRSAVAPNRPDRVASEIMRQAIGDRVTSDDIALVVVQRSMQSVTTRVASREDSGDSAELVFALPCDIGSAAVARRHVENFTAREQLGGMTDALATITTELVTNAVRHGAEPIQLTLRRTRETVDIEVDDGDPAVAKVQIVQPHRGPTGGRGLFLVARLADEWGTRLSSTGKTVWATVSIAGA